MKIFYEREIIYYRRRCAAYLHGGLAICVSSAPHAADSLRLYAEASSNENVNSPVEPVSPPVNIERLRDVSSDDEELMRELVELYLGQMSENIEKLKAAAQTDNSDELKRIAHTAIGSSATCGMDAVVQLLRELENTDYPNLSIDALPIILQVEEQFERIEAFLQESLLSVEVL